MTDRRQVIVGVEDLVMEPKDRLPLARHHTQLLYGEVFIVQDEKDGWCFGKSETDGEEGFVKADALSSTIHKPTHRIAVLRSAVYPKPTRDFLSLDALSFASPLPIAEEQNGFSRLAHGGWLRSEHLVPIETTWPDHTATAEKFMGIPYLWQGRSSGGIDCSALTQLALTMAGVRTPRHAKLQENADFGTRIDFKDPLNPQGLKRGDIVFFPGHVGIMHDGKTLLHANSKAMATTLDPIQKVTEDHLPGITAVKRLA